MAALAYPRQEAFAQGVARGQIKAVAGRAAGYKNGSGFIYKVAKRQVFIERVAEIVKTVAWSGSQSVVAVIDALKAYADRAAADDNELAGIKVAADILFKIATLKQQLPPDPLPDCVVAAFEKPLSVTLSVEEWSRQFLPQG
jgi:hypothetical protein